MTLSICLKNMWLKTTEEDCNLIKRKVIKNTINQDCVFIIQTKKYDCVVISINEIVRFTHDEIQTNLDEIKA